MIIDHLSGYVYLFLFFIVYSNEILHSYQCDSIHFYLPAPSVISKQICENAGPNKSVWSGVFWYFLSGKQSI